MENESTAIEVTLQQETVDAIVKAVSDVMVDTLNGFLISLREELQEIKSKTDSVSVALEKITSSDISEKGRLPGRRGKVFIGKEVKRFRRDYR